MRTESIRRMILMIILPFVFDAAVAGVMAMAEQSSPNHMAVWPTPRSLAGRLAMR